MFEIKNNTNEYCKPVNIHALYVDGIRDGRIAIS
jgi:hypothetical protein